MHLCATKKWPTNKSSWLIMNGFQTLSAQWRWYSTMKKIIKISMMMMTWMMMTAGSSGDQVAWRAKNVWIMLTSLQILKVYSYWLKWEKETRRSISLRNAKKKRWHHLQWWSKSKKKNTWTIQRRGWRRPKGSKTQIVRNQLPSQHNSNSQNVNAKRRQSYQNRL